VAKPCQSGRCDRARYKKTQTHAGENLAIGVGRCDEEPLGLQEEIEKLKRKLADVESASYLGRGRKFIRGN
jgi:hypothetical protein